MGLPQYIKDAQNNYNAQFDIIQVKLPKGTKERIRSIIGDGESMAAYCKQAILVAIESDEDYSLFSASTKASEPIAGIDQEELTVEMVQAMFDNKKIKQDKQAEEIKRQKEEIEKERLSKLANPEYSATYEQLQRAEIEAKETKRTETLIRARIESNI